MVKHIQTIRRLLATNCLSVFDHSVRLVLKGLRNSFVNKNKSMNEKKYFHSNFRFLCSGYASVFFGILEKDLHTE